MILAWGFYGHNNSQMNDRSKPMVAKMIDRSKPMIAFKLDDIKKPNKNRNISLNFTLISEW